MLWAMVNFLDVQKLAQEEIDSICGAQILPRYEDRAKMPYVESVIKEVLRMLPVSPLNIPHRATEDDYYRGVLIPKDSLIVANLWSFNHDSAKYADPFRFLPERHDGPSTPTAHLLHASSARRGRPFPFLEIFPSRSLKHDLLRSLQFWIWQTVRRAA